MLSEAGLPVIEATSFVSPKWVPQVRGLTSCCLMTIHIQLVLKGVQARTIHLHEPKWEATNVSDQMFTEAQNWTALPLIITKLRHERLLRYMLSKHFLTNAFIHIFSYPLMWMSCYYRSSSKVTVQLKKKKKVFAYAHSSTSYYFINSQWCCLSQQQCPRSGCHWALFTQSYLIFFP